MSIVYSSNIGKSNSQSQIKNGNRTDIIDLLKKNISLSVLVDLKAIQDTQIRFHMGKLVSLKNNGLSHTCK